MPLSDFWGAVSSHDEDSSDSNGSESPQRASDDNADSEELARLKRRQRTEKARVASLLSRQRRKLEEKHGEEAAADPVATFQRTFLASGQARKNWWNPFESGIGVDTLDKTAGGRSRAVFTYFLNMVHALRSLFLGNESAEPQPISHLLNINIHDDTNIKLASSHRSSRSVRPVLSNIQHQILIRSGMQDSDLPVWFLVHQPLIVLQRATARQLCNQFLAWSLHFAGQIGQRLKAWGVPHHLLKHVGRSTHVVVSDALAANDALFANLAKTIHYKSLEGPDIALEKTDALAVQLHCMIHQVSLTRRAMVLGFDGFWSSLVRLGHLFESHSFRTRFQASMARVIHESFRFVLCGSEGLPPEAATWRELKIQGLRLHSDHGHAGLKGSAISKRMRCLLQHMEKDSGNPKDPLIIHWCSGQSCCPGGEQEALACMTSSFAKLFDHVCVPLLYRWKHAPQACNFVRDGLFLHGILPKTLQGIPAMKCASSAF